MFGQVPEEVKIFLVEAYENLDQVERDLVNLEKDPEDFDLINRVFRAIHTIKGNCGFLGFHITERLCHKAETVLDKLRNKDLTVNAEIISALLSATDCTRRLCQQIEANGDEEGVETYQLVTKLHSFVEVE